MNCKPGDLAIFVRSAANNEGRIVTCLRYVGAIPGYYGDDWWETDTALPTKLGDRAAIARDSYIRPIRPGDISDEEVRDLYAPKVPEAA